MSARLHWIDDDGGRAAAGFVGRAGDCVARSVAIVTGLPYADVYAALADANASYRGRRVAASAKGVRTARSGVWTRGTAFKRAMAALGLAWTPIMGIGTGCTVHLDADEVPATGRYVLSLSKRYTALVNGELRDTHDPQRNTLIFEPGQPMRVVARCVYGWWTPRATEASSSAPKEPKA